MLPRKWTRAQSASENLRSHLRCEYVFPLLTLGGARAVANVVSANDQDSRLRPLPKDLGQCPHEDVIAAVGLEVPVDEGDNSSCRVRNNLIVECEADGRIGGDNRCVYPIMDDADF